MTAFLGLWNSSGVPDGTVGGSPPHEGELFYNGLPGIGLVETGNDATLRSLTPFTAFKCGALDVATELQYCYRYQLKDDQ